MTIEKVLQVVKTAFAMSAILAYLTIITMFLIALPFSLVFTISMTLGILTLLLSIKKDEKELKEARKKYDR